MASWGVLGAATDSEPPQRRRGAAKIPPGVVPGTPPKSDLKKIALGRPGASKTFPRWVPRWTPKTSTFKAQLGLHVGEVLKTQPQSNCFGGPSWPSKTAPIQKKSNFSNNAFPADQILFGWGLPWREQLGPPKNCSAVPWGSKTLTKIEPHLGFQN